MKVSRGDKGNHLFALLEDLSARVEIDSCLDVFAGDGSYQSIDLPLFCGSITALCNSEEKALRYKNIIPEHKVYVVLDSIPLCEIMVEEGRKFDLLYFDNPLNFYASSNAAIPYLDFQPLERVCCLASKVVIFNFPTWLNRKDNKRLWRERAKYYGNRKPQESYMFDFIKNRFCFDRVTIKARNSKHGIFYAMGEYK